MQIKDIYKQNKLHIQRGASNCGPTSLLNVLLLKDNEAYTEDRLAQLCNTIPGKGTDQESMISGAKAAGLTVVEYGTDAKMDDITRNIDNGNFVIVCYLHLYSGEGHYGLITEYDEDAFYFRDCSYGFMRLEKKDLETSWYNHDKTVRAWYMAIS